jgi:hypothetical protein
MPLTLIKQGRYGVSLATPCGTTGLAGCVGVATFKGGGWFIAHIDCAETRWHIPGVADEVSDYVEERMTAILGECTSTVHVVTSSFGDRSAMAIISGIAEWVGDGTADIRAWESNGLLITGGFAAEQNAQTPTVLRVVNVKGMTSIPLTGTPVGPAESRRRADPQGLSKFAGSKAELTEQGGSGSFSVPVMGALVAPSG